MSEVTRRSLLGTAAAAATGLIAAPIAGPVEAGQEPPEKKTLDYRFHLEALEPKVFPGGNTREANARNFPISTGIAGVSMRLQPGAIREMHWHANAAEWGAYLAGTSRVTIVSPDGQWETSLMRPGDINYIPRGYAHYIQNVGDDDVHFILVFDSGYFNEFSTFSATAWVAATPREVLAKNFGVPAETFDNFPKKEVYITSGTRPDPQELQEGLAANLETPGLTHKFRLGAQDPHAYPGGTLKLATVKNFPISTTVAGGIMTIDPGALREMHWHPNADEWQYYLRGKGRMMVFSPDSDVHPVEFGVGDVGYVPQGFGHFIENIGDEPLEVLLAFNNGNYQEISLAEWIAESPHQAVAECYKVPPDTFAHFRKKSGFLDAARRLSR